MIKYEPKVNVSNMCFFEVQFSIFKFIFCMMVLICGCGNQFYVPSNVLYMLCYKNCVIAFIIIICILIWQFVLIWCKHGQVHDSITLYRFK